MAERCIFCGREAKVIHYDSNMWYYRCSNPECKKHDKYGCLGSTQALAEKQWDIANRKGSFRKSCKDE